MIIEAQTRTAALIGEQALEKLSKAHVAVVGLGGVGGHCAEALARSGIGRLTLIDGDVVEKSNLNRQLIATKSTLGLPKAEAMRRRIEDICDCEITTKQAFLLPGQMEEALLSNADFIVDAIDTVSAKLALAAFAQERKIPIISSMGAGNRLDPSAFFVTDIFKTEGCPLARAMRQGCRKLKIERLPVVMSKEAPRPIEANKKPGPNGPGSVSFVPAAAGLVIAGYVVNQLILPVG